MTLDHNRFRLIPLLAAASMALVSTGFEGSARAAGPTLNAISRIQVEEAPDRTVISIEGSRRPTFTVFKLTSPQRLFIDIVDADVSKLEPTMGVDNGVIDKVTAVQYDAEQSRVGRIVVVFERDASYDIKTVGEKLLVYVDGAARNAPDLRLKAAQVEARRIEQAVARERQLLAQLKSARLEEERQRLAAKMARAQEENLAKKVAEARQAAEKASQRAETEYAKVLAELERLKSAKQLEQKKVSALADAVAAEKARKAALEDERHKAEELRTAVERAVAQEKAKLAAAQAQVKRAEAERKAAKKAADAAIAREAAARKLADAKASGKNLRRLEADLAKKDKALSRANSLLDKKKQALEEAQLAAAQAESRLKKANEERVRLERERRLAAERALEQERKRTSALKLALSKRATVEGRETAKVAAESEAAQKKLAELQARLSSQRKAVEAAQEQSEVESARIALLKNQLENEQAALKKLRAEREQETQRLAQVRETRQNEEARVADLQQTAKSLRAETDAAKLAYEKQVEALKRAKADADKARSDNAAAADALARAEAERQKALEDAEAARQAALAEAEAARKSALADAEKTRQAALAEAERLRKEAERLRAEGARAQYASSPSPGAAGKPSVGNVVRPVLRDVKFSGDADKSVLELAVSGDAPYKIVRHGARRVELKLSETTIPRALERSLDTTEFGGPVKLVSSFRSADDPGTVRVVIDLTEDASDSLVAKGDKLVWSFEPSRISRPIKRPKRQRPGRRAPPGVKGYPGAVAAEGGSVTTGGGGAVPASRLLKSRRKRGGKKYTGKKINLTIKDADIRHVLTFLAKEGGVNIVSSDKVKGKVTFHLENIPWDLALDMILKTQGYDYVRESGVYRVAPVEDIREEYEAELKKKKTISELKPMVVRFVSVNYADLDALKTHIATVLSKNGTVSVDNATSTLIIKDIEEHVQAAEDIVRRLDVQLPQVLIEARIVEASTTFSRELGIQWGGNFTMSPAFGNPTGLAFPAIIGVAGGADDTSAPTGGLLTSNPNFGVNLPAAAGAGAGGALGVTLGSLGGSANLALRLSAAEEQGSVKIISAPKILTLDGQEATIRQGVSIPISVVSANGVNTQFFNADLQLKVTTNSSPDGNIRLDLNISKNEPDFGQTSANGAPTIQKKEAETSLLVRDGETTVIGGIYTRNTGTSESSVPFLSKIPILGWLFTSTQERDNRSELMIFITPRIANRRASVVQGGGVNP